MRIAITPKPIIYFDGVCNLCNSAVQFVVRHDKKGKFLFAPLQSDQGVIAQEKANVPMKSAGTVLLFYRGKYYGRSAAALHTLRLLGGWWQIFFLFILVPPFIRNFVYDYIAAHRYKWFGKQEACMMPTPELKERFL